VQSGQAWRLRVFADIHELINRAIGDEKDLLLQRESLLNRSIHLINLLTIIFALIAIAIILFAFLYNIFISKRRKWLEGFLESVLNTSQNGIVHYKAIRERGQIVDFKIEYLNKTIKDLLKINSEDVLGKKLKEIPSFIRQSNLFERYVKVAESGVPDEFEIFYTFNHIDKWFYISLAKMEDGVT